jgi:hypothetical protein
MSVERRNFGKLPVSRDAFVQGTTYYKYNIVVNRGSSFMAKVDGVTAEPIATYNGTTHQFTVTDGWLLMSYGSDVVTMAEQIAGKANISDLENGTIKPYISEYAEDLSGSSTDRALDQDQFTIRTTAGSLSVNSSQPMRIKSIKGILDSGLHPFSAVQFRWNRFNQLNPSALISSAHVNGSTIESNSNYKIAYFRCVACQWGIYGSAEENNGYLFTDNGGNNVTPISVTYCASLPAIGSTVSGVTIHNTEANGYNYYLPAYDGYLCVEFDTTVNLANICAHIAWSNKDDDKYEVYVADATSGANKNLIDFSGIRNSIHNGIGLYGIFRAGYGVYDEIVFDEDTPANRKWYRRVDRTLLNGLTWSVETIDNQQGSTSYKFSATLSAIKEDGLFLSSYNDLTLTGKVLSSVSSTISTVEAFVAALGQAYIYYQLDSPAEGTHNVSGEAFGDDMSTEEYIFPSGSTPYATAITELSYVQGLKDYIRALPYTLSNQMKTIAEALNKHEHELRTLDTLSKHLGYAHCTELDADLIPTIRGKKMIKEVAGTPSGYPDFVGQIWIDTTTYIGYLAVRMSGNSSNDWKRITNA